MGKYIQHLNSKHKDIDVGNKAKNLAFLSKNRYTIPKTYICGFKAFRDFRDDKNVLSQIKRELNTIIDENTSYSIRSSASVEDTSDFSYAGQFETYLNIKGVDSILASIVKIWDSISGKQAIAYGEETGQSEVEMGVIIQEMACPLFSGVVFTRNPINGLNEIIIESVDGFGTQLVQEGITPERWKYKWESWTEKPSNETKKFEVIRNVVQEAINIEKEYGKPVDLEWVFDGKDIYWLQLREITTLNSTNIYSNRISREFLPGIIKPLVWSINIPVVNSSWKQLFKELLGRKAESININNLANQFYFRAYFNMGVVGDIFELLGMPRDALEILAGIEFSNENRSLFRPGPQTIQFLPNILRFIMQKAMFEKNIEKFQRDFQLKYKQVKKALIEDLNEEETLGIIEKLIDLNSTASYYVIMAQLLNSLFSMVLKTRLKKENISIEEFPENQPLLEFVDPRFHLAKLNKLYKKQSDSENLFKEENIDPEFLRELRLFKQRFGHLSDSGNDFTTPSWNEQPELIIEMIKATEQGLKPSSISLNHDLLKKKGNLIFFYKKAARYRLYRETVTFLYTYGYRLFRPAFLHLGSLLSKKNLLNDSDDIFYLKYPDIKKIISDPSVASKLRKRVRTTKEEIKKYGNVRLPEVIFEELPKAMLMSLDVKEELYGVPTSKGYHVGPVKVIKGVSDFKKVTKGDIIIIPFSDISWTPLFAKASAVISESGGILSHCSIVAREYRIPAIVSVNNIMTTLRDNMRIAVDGFNGKIQIIRD